MTAENPRVLIAEADPIARAFLAENLAADHYQPVCATDSAAALELLAGPLDALLVDVNGDTLAIVDLVRAETLSGIDPQLPILVLTSRTDGLHRTRLLERGADDVLAKPFSYPELRARLGALLRRAHARRAPRVLLAGSLRVDVRSRRAWVGEVEIEGCAARSTSYSSRWSRSPSACSPARNCWGACGGSGATPVLARSTRQPPACAHGCRSANSGSCGTCGASAIG